MTTTSDIQVIMCVDEGFAVPLAVSLASLDAASAGLDVRVHVVHPELTVELRDKVTQGLQTLRVEWIRIDDDQVQGAHYPEFLSRATVYRLLIGQLLPSDVRRVIYLDADTVVADSLAALYSAELGDADVIGAVREAGSPWAAGALGPPWRTLGLDPSSAYFNAGVMIIDLERWRSEDVGNRCLALLRQVAPRWGDQDGLNTILEGQWHELPRRWNVQSADFRGDATAWAVWREDVEAAVAAPAIIHYTERDKPWSAETAHPQSERWYEWLDRTAWAQWRPLVAPERRWEARARAVARSIRARRESRVSRLPL